MFRIGIPVWLEHYYYCADPIVSPVVTTVPFIKEYIRFILQYIGIMKH